MSTATPPPPPRPRIALGAGWWCAAAVVLAGLAWLVVGDALLGGGLMMAAGFALAAVLRLVLPEDRIGGLHMRGPRFDAAFQAGTALAVAAAVVLVWLREAA
ncbi:DUF3017 domain-containing protein [Mobilicoccus pelagius]|uniref:DUF3017 domain-containing protein n=1 Tax=Mobilicoccus pelagius NBRC 104925 TaxID=1089455 RepID=H5UU24_9MICO|nr:DUF3017 domain-containing protein [Mobilicoccus pelagius]GAB49232.1 hypothetical protein MOPEL_099_00320 [Mobilicoccus pelagius NBRC 104925]